MGARGPVPKRTDQRRRVNKPEIPVSTASASPARREPADPDWHPIALGWYESLAESGQSAFYQKSDWETARYVADAMSRSLKASRFSAQLFAAVMSATTSLLATEGDRRRLRIELERAKPKPAGAPDEVVTELDEYRRRAAGAG